MIIGRNAIENAITDFHGFFLSESGFEIKVEYDAARTSCKGVGERCRVCFSTDFCNFEISSNDDFHWALIVIGHEIAHYMHRHNEHNDRGSQDSRSIEDWADFFGTKIALTLITFGSITSQTYKEFPGNETTESRTTSIGRALGILASTDFNTDSKLYSNRISRVGLCVSGFNSFLDRYFGNIDVHRSLLAMKRIYSDETLKELILLESTGFLREKENIGIANSIHENIQSGDFEICKGLKEQYNAFIGTSYGCSVEERKRYVEIVKGIAKQQGLDLDGIDP